MALEVYYLIFWIILGSFILCLTEPPSNADSSAGEVRWVQQPEDIIVIKGSPVDLPCEAATRSQHTWNYTWFKDDTALGDSSGMIVLSSGTLRIKKVRQKENRTDEGVYHCEASCGIGTMRSRTATLRIAYLDRFFVPPQNTIGYLGDIVQLTCKIEGLPQPRITWYKNKQPLPQDEKHVQLHTGVLQILQVSKDDEGSYQCVASNSVRRRYSSKADLTVYSRDNLYGPVVLAQPENTTAMAGDDVILACAASGNPPPEVAWHVPVKDPGRQRGIGHQNLLITSVEPGDAGVYTCQLSSDAGETLDLRATLKVIEQPQVSPATGHIRQKRLMPFRLYCDYSGTPRPTIAWYKNGKKFQHVDDEEYDEIHEISGTAYRTSHVVHESEEFDSGIYQCVAQNSAGSASGLTSVDIYHPIHSPEPPRILRAEAKSSTEIALYWKAAKSDLPIIGYSVHYVPTEVWALGTQAELQKVADENATSVTIDALIPYTSYTMYLRAFNSEGGSRPSDKIIQVTAEAVCERGPEFDLISSGTNSLLVTWSDLPKQDARGNITHWKIEYRVHSSSNFESGTVFGQERRFRITNLMRGEKYDVRVICETGAGFPVSASERDFPWKQFTVSGTEDSVLQLTPNSTSVNVTWRLKGDIPSVDSFILKYTKMKEHDADEAYEEVDISVDKSSYVIRGLEPDQQYEIEFFVGPRQYYQTVWTSDVRPVPALEIPRDVRCESDGPNSIRVRWSLSKVKSASFHVRYTAVQMQNGNPIVNESDYKFVEVEKSNSTVLRNLKPFTLYQVQVRAFMAGSTSEWSTVSEGQTMESKPGPPQNLIPSAQSPGLIEVRWSPPKEKNGIILQYHLWYALTNMEKEPDWSSITLNGTEFLCKLKDLVVDGLYVIKIRAATSIGPGKFSPELEAQAGPVLPTSTTQDDGDSRQLVFFLTIAVLGLSFVVIIGISLIILCKTRNNRSEQNSPHKKYGCSTGCDKNHSCNHSNGYPSFPLYPNVGHLDNPPVCQPMLENDNHIDSKGGKSPPGPGRCKNGFVTRTECMPNGKIHTLLAESDQEETGFGPEQTQVVAGNHLTTSESNATAETLCSNTTILQQKEFCPDEIDYNSIHSSSFGSPAPTPAAAFQQEQAVKHHGSEMRIEPPGDLILECTHNDDRNRPSTNQNTSSHEYVTATSGQWQPSPKGRGCENDAPTPQ